MQNTSRLFCTHLIKGMCMKQQPCLFAAYDNDVAPPPTLVYGKKGLNVIPSLQWNCVIVNLTTKPLNFPLFYVIIVIAFLLSLLGFCAIIGVESYQLLSRTFNVCSAGPQNQP